MNRVFPDFPSLLLGILLTMLFAGSAAACPEINGLVDVNCDRRLVIAAFGDSITFGLSDALDPTGKPYGYPGRLKLSHFPNVEIRNLGKPGEATKAGVIRANQIFPGVSDIDYTVILQGVNDYYDPERLSITTKNNVLSIFRTVRNTGSYGLISNLTDVKRSFQRKWVLDTNRELDPSRSIDFFGLGVTIIGQDGLHPNSGGYQVMANRLAVTLKQFSDARRPLDSDQDGLYDYEEARFGTLINNPDFDGDGIKDGIEVYTYGSNPKSLDSDNDGLSDNYEVFTLGSNPANPAPGAPTITNLTIIP